MKIVSLLFMLSLALAFVFPVNALKPVIVNGPTNTCDSFIQIVSSTVQDDQIITVEKGLQFFGGGLEGALNQTMTLIIDSTTLQGTFTATGIFNGMVRGSPRGTATVSLTGTIDLTTGITNGTGLLKDGTAGIQGVHGIVTFSIHHYEGIAICYSNPGAHGTYAFLTHSNA